MSKIKEFYAACRSGDIQTVKQLLPTITDEQKQSLDSANTTALHAATYYGHYEIVKLLLENGFDASLINKYSNTPYDEARDDKMRQLFYRSNYKNDLNRFSSPEIHFKPMKRTSPRTEDQVADDANIPQFWFNSYKKTGTSQAIHGVIQTAISIQMMKYSLKKLQVSSVSQDIARIMKKSIPSNHIEWKRANKFFENYQNKHDVSQLLRLYTLETPFYDALQQNSDSFAFKLYSHLLSLGDRAFQGGKTYRSFEMTFDCIYDYEWANKNKGRIVEVKTLLSTSASQTIVDTYTKHANRSTVMCIFNFPQICYTAIDLNVNKSLSTYAFEKEILILPGTLFEVIDIAKDRSTGRYVLRLENISVSQEIFKKALIDIQNL